MLAFGYNYNFLFFAPAEFGYQINRQGYGQGGFAKFGKLADITIDEFLRGHICNAPVADALHRYGVNFT